MRGLHRFLRAAASLAGPAIVEHRRRIREAVDVAKGLPISPWRARLLLDALGSREALVAHVEREQADARELPP